MQQSLSDQTQESDGSKAVVPDKVEEPATPTNHETNFFKFLKKDFEDLSLGPIKRPKKKKTAKANNMSQISSSHADQEAPDGAAPENQEAAAAAWRAARAQKSCLHSGKPESGKSGKGGDEDSAGSKWSQLETTWRVSTLPFRCLTMPSFAALPHFLFSIAPVQYPIALLIPSLPTPPSHRRLAHAAIAVNWKPRTRPSWSKALDQVASMPSCSASLLSSGIRARMPAPTRRTCASTSAHPRYAHARTHARTRTRAHTHTHTHPHTHTSPARGQGEDTDRDAIPPAPPLIVVAPRRC